MQIRFGIGNVSIDRLIINHVEQHHHGRPELAILLGPISEQKASQKVPLTLQITDSQEFDISVGGGVDKKGNPAGIQGDVLFESSDAGILELSNVQSRSVHVRAVGALGIAQITLTADVDLSDEGVKNINDQVTVNVVGGEAVGFAISAGEPTEQPDA